MTEKVVLTKEQAEAIERWSDKEQLIIAKIVGLLEHGIDEPIYTLTTKELIQAIYIGYEVKSEFKVGDWVICKKTKQIGQIEEYGIWDDSVWVTNDEFNFFTDYRHATPSEIAEEKERRWWAKHGREPWELRYNDTLICGKSPRIVDKIADLKEKTVIFTDGDWEYFDNVKEEYKVLVFAEKRLDVK